MLQQLSSCCGPEPSQDVTGTHANDRTYRRAAAASAAVILHPFLIIGWREFFHLHLSVQILIQF